MKKSKNTIQPPLYLVMKGGICRTGFDDLFEAEMYARRVNGYVKLNN